MSHLSSSHARMRSWTIMKVECRIDKLWCWRRLLRGPWTSRRSNQSILKEINSLEGNWEEILKEISHWRHWCWSLSSEAPILRPPDAKSQVVGKDPGAGKDWGQEKEWEQRIRWLNGIIDLMDRSLSKLWQIVKDREAWHSAVHEVTKNQAQLGN